MHRPGRAFWLRPLVWCALLGCAAAILAALGCMGVTLPGLGGGQALAGIFDRHATGIVVPAPDGAGGSVVFPGPGDPEWQGSERGPSPYPSPVSGTPGEDLPPPPPSITPIPTAAPGEGGLMPTFRGVFLGSVGGSFDGNFAPKTANGSPVAAAGVLLASADAISGSGHVEIIMADNAGVVWDVVALGELSGNTIVANRFVSSTNFAFGGRGTASDPSSFALDGAELPPYTITDPAVAGTLTATLPETREEGAALSVEVNVRTKNGEILDGTYTGSITAVARVAPPQ